jgi:RimJ/RimL family protein N-acetyltransferase
LIRNQVNYLKKNICLTTNRLTIREFRQNDLEALLAYEKQPEMLQFEPGIPDSEAAQRYINNTIQCAMEEIRTKFFLAITITPNDQAIGRISLTSQNPSIDEWEIGWAIRKDDWGKGYATEAALEMLNFAFRVLQAHRVVAFCHADNTKSARVMEKIGMTREGYLRQTRCLQGSWADELVYAILDVDFLQDAS